MQTTRRQFFLLALAALPVSAKGVLDWARETLMLAEKLDGSKASGQLFAIKSKLSDSQAQVRAHPERFFHGYPVRGQARLQGSDTQRLLRALSQSLRRGASLGRVSDCFEPHHALRLESRSGNLDLLICFDCEQAYAFGQGRPLHGYLSGGREIFEEVARAHGLPAAPPSGRG